jgi:GNAT superfamily N-acetyltransferase
LRAAEYPRDAARTVAIYNAWSLEPTTVEDVMEQERRVVAGKRRHRLVALNPAGAVIGYAEATYTPWQSAGHYEVELCMDRAWRGIGAGVALWSAMLAWLRAEGATQIEVQLRDNEPEAQRFAETRGFVRGRHLFESTLDLASFDERPFTDAIARAQAAGYRFFSLAEVGDTEEARRGDYEINRRAALDIPGREQTFAPFEEWRRFVCEASWYRPDGQIIAAHGDQWVGLAAVGYYAATNSMYNMVTGVDRAHRGQGVAQALKLLAIRCARRYGAVYIRTHNDSENAPMLAINRKLGYQPQPGLYQYTLTLTAE